MLPNRKDPPQAETDSATENIPPTEVVDGLAHLR